jgi:hypothetical protein
MAAKYHRGALAGGQAQQSRRGGLALKPLPDEDLAFGGLHLPDNLVELHAVYESERRHRVKQILV